MQEISSQSAIDLIENNSDLVIVDVRTEAEYGAGHIEGALNIDLNSLNFKDEIDKLDKNKKYLVYCRSGNRSRIAGKIIEALGFNDVYNLDGGVVGNPDLLK